MGWKTLDDMDLDDKRVLVRVDINVPMQDGVVSDDTRIIRIVPTVRDILAAGGIPVLLAHFGRPKGQRRPEFSLQPLVVCLEQALGTPVMFAADCIGAGPAAALQALPKGEVLLLENTRYHAAEEANDPGFAAQIAKLGDIYCNDAFSAAHRAHASTEALARVLPSCAGRLMAAELDALETALGAPKHPVVAVVGGAKVSTKLALLSNLVTKVDHLVIGGGMANTFLAAQGHSVGTSLAEHDMTDTASDILARATATGCEIILPSDVVVAREFAANAPHQTVAINLCPADGMILDAGAQTVARITDCFSTAKTLIWNGPLGAFELEPFDTATNAAARQAANLTKAGGLVSVAGGGDTVAALNKAGVADTFSYLSTAGGAFLEWMEGKTLPGVAALQSRLPHQ
ncbi:MAG TPA: phosphoglycerate kinase [Rhodobacteraceae bacterium]|mgnify:FL=1|jgi:phosphoglycerate kinase|nr:phosphoglycerate kinase [Paracoccaceae bacterium]|tara:strand:+ start:3008 stop:4213 length:1206 start_codon:yes stop_codon:yes gene_type:complete